MKELWNGFEVEKLEFEGKEACVVFPKEGTSNGRLMVKTEYWDAFPEAIEIPLLKKGLSRMTTAGHRKTSWIARPVLCAMCARNTACRSGLCLWA